MNFIDPPVYGSTEDPPVYGLTGDVPYTRDSLVYSPIGDTQVSDLTGYPPIVGGPDKLDWAIAIGVSLVVLGGFVVWYFYEQKRKGILTVHTRKDIEMIVSTTREGDLKSPELPVLTGGKKKEELLVGSDRIGLHALCIIITLLLSLRMLVANEPPVMRFF